MRGPKFDFENGDFIFGDDKFGFNSKGHFMVKTGKNSMMDVEKGDIHFVSDTPNDDINNLLNLNDDK